MASVKTKIKRYQKIILDYLNYKASIKAANLPECENFVIADTNSHRYQVITVGWDGLKYVHSTCIHIDISADAKIWFRLNETDVDISALFVKQGVPNMDIVLGFHPEYMRQFSDYAIK